MMSLAAPSSSDIDCADSFFHVDLIGVELIVERATVKVLIHFELSLNSSADRLEFKAERKLGLGILAIYPIVSFILFVLCGIVALSQEYPPDWSVGIAIGAAISLLAYPFLVLLGRVNRFAVLTADKDYLAATGRGVGKSPWGSSSVRISIAQVEWLGYLAGSVRGLHASLGPMRNICLLAGISREQATGVISAIADRFPAWQERTAGAGPKHPSVIEAPASPSFGEMTRASLLGQELIVANPSPSHTETWGKTTLTIEESPRELRFRADHQAGSFQRNVLPVLLAVVVLAVGIPIYRVSTSIFLAAFAADFAFYWFLRKMIKPFESTTLSVDPQRFEATGDSLIVTWVRSHRRSGQISIPVEEITSFCYRTGTDEEPDGLWVNTGFWKNRCLLPGIDRQKGVSVMVAIVRKFPELAAKARQ